MSHPLKNANCGFHGETSDFVVQLHVDFKLLFGCCWAMPLRFRALLTCTKAACTLRKSMDIGSWCQMGARRKSRDVSRRFQASKIELTAALECLFGRSQPLVQPELTVFAEFIQAYLGLTLELDFHWGGSASQTPKNSRPSASLVVGFI
jgi:hypothetical protein